MAKQQNELEANDVPQGALTLTLNESQLYLLRSFLLDRVGESILQEEEKGRANNQEAWKSTWKEDGNTHLVPFSSALNELRHHHAEATSIIAKQREEESAAQATELGRLEGVDQAYRNAVAEATKRYAAELRNGTHTRPGS